MYLAWPGKTKRPTDQRRFGQIGDRTHPPIASTLSAAGLTVMPSVCARDEPQAGTQRITSDARQ